MNTNEYISRRGGFQRMAVKGLLCMAFLMAHALVLTSCSDDLNDADVTNYDPFMRGYSNEQIKLQRLGYAYNAAGNVMDDASFSASPIVNMNRILEAENKYGQIISAERRHYTSVDIFSGNTIQELGHSETKYTIDDSEAIGSGKFYRNNSTFSTSTWHSSYKAHMFVKHIMGTKTIDAGLLRCLNLDDLNNANSVLEADFRKAVADLVRKGNVDTADAVTFSEKYGTHLVVSSNLGGMIELQMEIKRDSCVSKEYTTTTVTQLILGKEVVKTSEPMYLKPIASNTVVEYQGQVNVKGGTVDDIDKMHKTFDEKKAAAVRISDADYTGWAGRISMEPETYNATFVSGRFLPLYELFEDATTRTVMREVYKKYMKKEAPTPEVYEPAYGVMPVQGNYGPEVRVASAGTDKACIICQEYVPSIRSDKPCIVAYPLLKGVDGNVRPFLFSGLFIGDESHRPGYVTWKGSASFYVPSDSIFENSDNAAIHDLFDHSSHSLKNVYFYWNAVHPQPCPTKNETPKAYTTYIYTAQPAALNESTSFAKVASTFWSVRPVKLKPDNLVTYWNTDEKFTLFTQHRYNTDSGVLYNNGKYNFCLVDGGDNIKRAPEYTDDKDASKQWIDAVSRSVKAIGLNDYLPVVWQSKSITQMLGNRMSIFYAPYYADGRNMLGLDWSRGYWVIGDADQQTMATVHTQVDGQGIPIITNDAGQTRILRLSGSGTDLLLEYPEYVKAFSYSDQAFFKFFPIYITTDKF